MGSSPRVSKATKPPEEVLGALQTSLGFNASSLGFVPLLDSAYVGGILKSGI
jgi:hypothetical protein